MSISKDHPIFQPFTVKSLTLKNRIVMAPMTRSFSPEGIPGRNVADYYRRRAEADVGLILSEGTGIDRVASRNDPDVPFFKGEQSLAGWKNVIDTVHAAGGRMAPQLWHVGAAASQSSWRPEGGLESPSGLIGAGKQSGHAMSENDIVDTIAAFGKAAADAKRLGFDAAELHGAHGYLIDQFFWPVTNQRTDLYGGKTIAERNRFAVEVIKSVRAAVGEDFPVILRVSQWKSSDFSARIATTPDEMREWLLPLVEAGVDVLHCSQRRFWEPEFPEVDGENGLNFAGWAKKLTGAATISVGSVGLSGEFLAAFRGESSQPASVDGLTRRVEAGEFDLIAVGRALLSDAEFVRKLETGVPTSGFSAKDLQTLY
jgi:2,4-dienoyl-CoA reductase-like NADH-dependent reductase (Old Yellow Enzyme family)